MAYQYQPGKPMVNVDSDNFVWKEWFLSLWRYIRGQSTISLVKVAAFTCDLDTFFYPCDTTAGAFAVTIPLAANSAGKQYVLQKAVASANALTFVASGADAIISGPAALTIANNTSVILVSGGTAKWYCISKS